MDNENNILNPLQLREIFHLEFLRWFGRKMKDNRYALKGGVNMRFFFKSFRYSEDMDLDVEEIAVDTLRDAVMKVLVSDSFLEGLMPFGIQTIVPPDMRKAKQTQTTQRFKVHLITENGMDLFTKVEFSRRGFSGGIIVQPVLMSILRVYQLPPILVSHYDIAAAVSQKISAVVTRKLVQARDIFDLYILSSQYDLGQEHTSDMDQTDIARARDIIFDVSYNNYRDTVVAYLGADDQVTYDATDRWDDIKLKVIEFIEELSG